MTDRSAQLWLVAAAIISVVIGLLLLANITPVNNACPWQFPKIFSCLLSARETLSAGLIGTGGAVFAGWLAYSAAQASSAEALNEALEAKKATIEQQVTNYSDELDRLRLARAYLETFATHFPATPNGGVTTGFAQALRQVHVKALDVVSSSAVRAPYGYGAQISTVMTRINTLGERMEETIMRQPVINIDAAWSDQIFEMIAGIRSLAQQMSTDIPVHEKHLKKMADERDTIKKPLTRAAD